MRTLAILLALALVTFSGCTDPGDQTPAGDDPATDPGGPDEGNDAPDDGSDPGGDDPAGNGTGTPNVPPTANLTADALTGAAPLTVHLLLNGSDADGDPLSWNISVDGVEIANGTTLPANATHLFEEVGTFFVLASVFDGQNTTMANLTIETVAAGPVQVIPLAWSVGVSDLGAAPEFLECEAGPMDGTTHKTFTVNADAAGIPFTATITGASDGTAITAWGLVVADPACGATAYELFDVDGAAEISGTMPAGYTFGYAFSEGGAMLEATITIG